jgi:3-deoxy-D-manno-octulosonate 8-phosphate phosphatase (KDO 8-P phosphatase)
MFLNERISKLLKERKIKQKTLAAYIGISPKTLNGWLLYGRSIPADYVMPICKFFDELPEYMLTDGEFDRNTGTFFKESAEPDYRYLTLDQDDGREKIKLLVMDVDGTLTDGKLYFSAQGEELKAFHAKDGYGIGKLLPARGLVPAIITGRTSRILERRCAELKIEHLFQGISDKATAMRELLTRLSLQPEQAAYIGDDDNDLGAMRICALRACPADASERIKAGADFVAARRGGEGAVREFIEWLIDNARI